MAHNENTSPTNEASEGFSTKGAYVTSGAEFDRDTNYIEDRIVADPDAVRALPAPPKSKVGSLGYGLSEGAQAWPVEPGRYRLIAANACPWNTTPTNPAARSAPPSRPTTTHSHKRRLRTRLLLGVL